MPHGVAHVLQHLVINAGDDDVQAEVHIHLRLGTAQRTGDGAQWRIGVCLQRQPVNFFHGVVVRHRHAHHPALGLQAQGFDQAFGVKIVALVGWNAGHLAVLRLALDVVLHRRNIADVDASAV